MFLAHAENIVVLIYIRGAIERSMSIVGSERGCRRIASTEGGNNTLFNTADNI